MEITKRGVTSAEQNVTVVQRSLAEGLSSQLEFRTAENSFLETKGALFPLRISKMWLAPNGIARRVVTFNFPRTLRETRISC